MVRSDVGNVHSSTPVAGFSQANGSPEVSKPPATYAARCGSSRLNGASPPSPEQVGSGRSGRSGIDLEDGRNAVTGAHVRKRFVDLLDRRRVVITANNREGMPRFSSMPGTPTHPVVPSGRLAATPTPKRRALPAGSNHEEVGVAHTAMGDPQPHLAPPGSLDLHVVHHDEILARGLQHRCSHTATPFRQRPGETKNVRCCPYTSPGPWRGEVPGLDDSTGRSPSSPEVATTSGRPAASSVGSPRACGCPRGREAGGPETGSPVTRRYPSSSEALVAQAVAPSMEPSPARPVTASRIGRRSWPPSRAVVRRDRRTAVQRDGEVFLGRSRKGVVLSGPGSLGRPRTRSPMMLRCTWSLPP